MSVNATGEMIMSSQVAQALKILGDRWTFLILREVFQGRYRFEDFRRQTDAARSTLTSRLLSLIETGVLQKVPYQTLPTRYDYLLTDKGADLYPIALTAWRWEHDWAGDAEHHIPWNLIHRICGNAMLPELRCELCRDIVRIRDVRYAPGPGANHVEPLPSRFHRRSKTKSNYPDGVDTKFFQLVDIIGDRWTGLIVAALFFGLRRYDEIGAAIGIATNILSHRLKLLFRTGIVTREPFRYKPKRYEYKLTDKGRDLYGLTLMVHQWADKWVTGEHGPPLLLTHTSCGKALRGIVVCSECSQELVPGTVLPKFSDNNQESLE